MPELPKWALMWFIAFSLYGLCKGLTLLRTPRPVSRPGLWIYLLVWPGMNAPDFFHRRPPRPFRGSDAVPGSLFIATGLILLPLAGALADPMARGIAGMTAVVFLLHFGLFRLLSDLWQARGWQAPPLMDAPILATSLSDFWGRRWNRAYRDLTHQFLYRPLAKRLSPTIALLTGFTASGLIHELVLTVPAGGGYGGPTLYFVLQGVGLLSERTPTLRHHPRLRTGFARVMLLAPLPWLFPPEFIREVMAPFLSTLTHT